ncbi:hypothetical protein ACROYT_G020446 [Oculina patagonica]
MRTSRGGFARKYIDTKQLKMKIAIISTFLLVACISMSSFALPSYYSCLNDCDIDYDLCIGACGQPGYPPCSVCSPQWNQCRADC